MRYLVIRKSFTPFGVKICFQISGAFLIGGVHSQIVHGLGVGGHRAKRAVQRDDLSAEGQLARVVAEAGVGDGAGGVIRLELAGGQPIDRDIGAGAVAD